MESNIYKLLNTVLCQDDLRNIIQKLAEEDEVDDKTAELASRKGVINVVEKYLKEGNDVNKMLDITVSGRREKTCLLANSIGGEHLDIVRLVLEHGGHKSIHFEDKYRRTCLQKALITENKKIIELLLSYGDWMDNLTAAIYIGDVDAVNSLIKSKPANVTINALQKNIIGSTYRGKNYYTETSKRIVYDLHVRTWDTSLHFGMINVVKLLASGWDGMERHKRFKGPMRRLIDQNQRLYEAASYGNTEIVKFLIEIGAEIDVSRALFAAASYNHAKCVEFLIEAGANIEEEEFRYGNKTAVAIAVETNSVDAAKILIKHGACIDMVDYKGRSLLTRAAKEGFVRMTELLLFAKENGKLITPESLTSALDAGFSD